MVVPSSIEWLPNLVLITLATEVSKTLTHQGGWLSSQSVRRKDAIGEIWTWTSNLLSLAAHRSPLNHWGSPLILNSYSIWVPFQFHSNLRWNRNVKVILGPYKMITLQITWLGPLEAPFLVWTSCPLICQAPHAIFHSTCKCHTHRVSIKFPGLLGLDSLTT